MANFTCISNFNRFIIKNYIFCFIAILVLVLTSISCNNDVSLNPEIEPYSELLVIDIHNHDANNKRYVKTFKDYDRYSIDKIVLFGDISCTAAIESDKLAFKAYKDYPDRFYPFIAGINIFDSACLDYIRERFEAGVFGIGEVVGASIYSPIASAKEWKGEHPLDGYFPEIYELCSEYNKPILLHLDPPIGIPVEKLIEAAELYPNTNFYFRSCQCI